MADIVNREVKRITVGLNLAGGTYAKRLNCACIPPVNVNGVLGQKQQVLCKILKDCRY